MSNVIVSPNMNLPVPIPGQETGPAYASDITSCMSVIDSHNHAFGNGVQITPNGLNINTDLPLNSNNLVSVRTVRFTPQASAITASSPDLGVLYGAGASTDLYYNDGAGNQVRITQSGGVAGSPGSISNLTSPASAAYVSGTSTFIWESDVNTAATMDMGSIILRLLTAGSAGITISPSSSLTSSYSITLPAALPGSTSYLNIDSAGNVSTSSTAFSNSVSTSSIQSAAVTNDKFAPANYGISTTTGALSLGATGGFAAITQLSTTITTVGRPVRVQLQPDGNSVNGAYITNNNSPTNIALFIDGTVAYRYEIIDSTSADHIPPGSFNWFVPALAAGSHTFAIYYTAGSTWGIFYTQLVVQEV